VIGCDIRLPDEAESVEADAVEAQVVDAGAGNLLPAPGEFHAEERRSHRLVAFDAPAATRHGPFPGMAPAVEVSGGGIR
jgi:hypothetical protein